MNYSEVFQPGKIGKLTIKNRLVMPPMVRNYATSDGRLTARYISHLESIAKGGIGLMILEASFISEEGKGFVNQLSIARDSCIPGLRRVVKICHRYGVKVGIQLHHAGRQTSSKICGQRPLAPSAIADPTIGEVPQALKINQIEEVVAKYAEAALRAKRAGLDFVEIHAAHGYLITQFLSGFSNKRKDRYGGSFENRLRFLLEIIDRTKQLVGNDFPLIVRLSGAEYVKGGLTIAETKRIAQALEKKGVSALHISAGNYASYAQGVIIPPMAKPQAPLLPLAAEVKKVVKIPVIAVGKIHDPSLINEILKKKQADFVAIGRALLADPQWPNKIKNGQEKEINPCIACNQGCISRLFLQKDVWCTVNPECGRERLFAKKRGKRRKVLVVGGGPAGMSAARWASLRGHDVTLFEKQKFLGGNLNIVTALPYRENWHLLRDKLIRDLKRYGVKVYTKTKFVPDFAVREKADAVIVAVGASPKVANIPGIFGRERNHVFSAQELLADKCWPRGKKIVVVGGGCTGAQTAEFLVNQTSQFWVTLVEAGNKIAADSPVDERFLLLQRLKKKKVKLMLNAELVSVGDNTVTVKTKHNLVTIPADSVVLALGLVSNDGLQFELKKVVKKVIVIGDARNPRTITEAILEGALAALSLS